MITRHRAAPPGIGVFRLSSENLGSDARVGSEAYHARTESRAPVFFSEYATETPSLAMVQDLPQDKRDYHAVRHAGKRGRDLFTD